MKSRFSLGLSVFSACCGLNAAACSGDGSRSSADAGVTASVTDVPSSTPPNPTAPATVTSPTPTLPPTPSMTATPAGGTGGMGGTSGLGGVGGTGGGNLGGTGGIGPTCDINIPTIFPRSDTEEVWDDNDFSDVVLEGTCPVLVNVTWPHEEGWENADPSDANHEQTHFTLDVGYSSDLTGKQINLTIELAEHQLGPAATAAGYIVSIVSVSTYDRVVVVEPDPVVSDAGLGDGGLLSDAGLLGNAELSDASVSSDAGLLSDAGDASTTEPEGPVTQTSTGYQEAESAPDERAFLRRAGDRSTITFALPNKTAEADSYDPTRVIKINVRIYNAFTGEEVTPPDAEPSVDGGLDLDGGVSLDAGEALSSSALSSSAADASIGSDAGLSTDGAPPATSGPVYDYLTSQFVITNFNVTDVTGL